MNESAERSPLNSEGVTGSAEERTLPNLWTPSGFNWTPTICR